LYATEKKNEVSITRQNSEAYYKSVMEGWNLGPRKHEWK
jgi:hypothetical protein